MGLGYHAGVVGVGRARGGAKEGGGGGCDVMVAHSLNVKHMTPP